jgi:hypothetical protein
MRNWPSLRSVIRNFAARQELDRKRRHNSLGDFLHVILGVGGQGRRTGLPGKRRLVARLVAIARLGRWLRHGDKAKADRACGGGNHGGCTETHKAKLP